MPSDWPVSTAGVSAAAVAVSASISSQKTDPTPSWLVNPTPPPISSARRRVMARPRPDPPNRRLMAPSAWVKRWNKEACALSAMPMPLSSISNLRRTRPGPDGLADRRASTRPSVVNFTALPMRLNSA